MKLTDLEGREHHMTVEVPKSAGAIYVRANGGRRYKLDPATVARMRNVYAEAIGVALQDRGAW